MRKKFSMQRMGIHRRGSGWRSLAAAGMTLIEFVVVVACVALLAGILVPIVGHYLQSARETRAQADCKAIGEAIAAFRNDVKQYPTTRVGGGGQTNWYWVLVGGTAATVRPVDTTGTWFGTPPRVGLLEQHLQTNGPGYPAWTNATMRGWRGPYLQPSAGTTIDPWGYPYIVNVEPFVTTAPTAPTPWVLSAGRNASIETARTAAASVQDDIAFNMSWRRQ